MKRILHWIEEEKIAITVLLLGIGVILNSQPNNFVFTGMFLYGSVLIIITHLIHKLYLKLRR
ncbi:MAG: hypothetical protein AABY09_01075 [Nanoarchaeota archaeon]